MAKNNAQSGFMPLLVSTGSKPLQNWEPSIRNGHIKKITDPDIQTAVLEILGTNVSTNFITFTSNPKETPPVKFPYFNLIMKNLKRYFSFEIQVMDDKNVKRTFRASNYQSTTRVKPAICTMPMRLDEGWNQIQFNLADFTKRAYGTNYVETVSIQIHANCRIRKVYFTDRYYSEEELPPDYKLYLPISNALV